MTWLNITRTDSNKQSLSAGVPHTVCIFRGSHAAGAESSNKIRPDRFLCLQIGTIG